MEDFKSQLHQVLADLILYCDSAESSSGDLCNEREMGNLCDMGSAVLWEFLRL